MLTLERTCFKADLIAISIQWDYDFIVHYIKKKLKETERGRYEEEREEGRKERNKVKWEGGMEGEREEREGGGGGGEGDEEEGK